MEMGNGLGKEMGVEMGNGMEMGIGFDMQDGNSTSTSPQALGILQRQVQTQTRVHAQAQQSMQQQQMRQFMPGGSMSVGMNEGMELGVGMGLSMVKGMTDMGMKTKQDQGQGLVVGLNCAEAIGSSTRAHTWKVPFATAIYLRTFPFTSPSACPSFPAERLFYVYLFIVYPYI
jgi:hypothetical protein